MSNEQPQENENVGAPRPTSLQQQCFNHVLLISDAFQRDCEKLLRTFREMNSVSFIDFAKVWRSMSFSCVFGLEKMVTELKHFTQKAFVIAKKYLIYGEDVYTRIGGLYLLYGLYHEQPFVGLVKIRLTCDDYVNLMSTLSQIKAHNSNDAAYIFAQMKLDGCFQYVAFDKRYVPEFSHFWNKPDEVTNEIFLNKAIEDFTKDCSEVFDEKNGVLGQLKTIDEEYKKALKNYSENNPSSNLTSFNISGMEELHELSKKILGENVAQTPESVVETSKLTEDGDTSMTLTKKRAFKRKVPQYRQ